MNFTAVIAHGAFVIMTLLTLVACGGGGGSGGGVAVGIESVSDGVQNGQLSIGITDAELEDVTAVWVTFIGVTLKPQDGEQLEFDLDPAVEVNLLTLSHGTYMPLLEAQSVPAGRYNWIRLHVAAAEDGSIADAFVLTMGGGMEELEIPSALQNGLRLVSGFTVLAGQHTQLVLDWDLKKALVYPGSGGAWKLRPALRITDLAVYGRIEGAVAPGLFGSGQDCNYDATLDSGNAVYAYEGDVSEPDDIDGVSGDPYATAMVKFDAGANEYRYAFEFMKVGEYTLAFTCQAANDSPDVDNIIDFTVLAETVTVVDDQTTQAPRFE
jgi:hypothetical protein